MLTAESKVTNTHLYFILYIYMQMHMHIYVHMYVHMNMIILNYIFCCVLFSSLQLATNCINFKLVNSILWFRSTSIVFKFMFNNFDCILNNYLHKFRLLLCFRFANCKQLYIYLAIISFYMNCICLPTRELLRRRGFAHTNARIHICELTFCSLNSLTLRYGCHYIETYCLDCILALVFNSRPASWHAIDCDAA